MIMKSFKRIIESMHIPKGFGTHRYDMDLLNDTLSKNNIDIDDVISVQDVEGGIMVYYKANKLV